MSFVYLLVGLIVGFIVGWVAKPEKKTTKVVEEYANEDAKQKAENLAKVEEFIKDKDKFTNDDLEKLLKVSNTTIGRYLEELEKDGKIKQIGDTGSGVYYVKKFQ